MHSARRFCLQFLLALLLVAAAVAPGRAGPREPELGLSIRLLAATFDPLREPPVLPPELTAPAAGSRYALVQFRGPIQPQWKEAAAAAGAELLDYIPDYAFVARLAPGAAEALSRLSAVRWLGPFHPAYRLSPGLAAAARADPQRTLDLRARLFPGEDPAALERTLAALGATIAGRWPSPWGATLRLSLPAGALAEAAGLDGVAWLEPVRAREPQNDVARSIIGLPAAWSRLPDLYGAAQVVAIADTGLDTGDPATLAADLSGRLIAAFPLGRPGDWSDREGHGTHVAGSAVGSGVLSGSRPASHDYSTGFAGVAPEAGLVVQAFGVDPEGHLTGIPADLKDLFQQAYDRGARIHNNSWGGPSGEPPNEWGGYDLDCAQVDQFAWDHRDATILFSAGNGGVDADGNGVIDPDSIRSPGTAKNAITVGASESVRASGGLSEWTWLWFYLDEDCLPGEPIRSDRPSNNPSGLAAFSSRGPADDGRIKPELVAPGTNLISARSHLATKALWGEYDAHYLYGGGTSMSTPLVAGAAALVRQWYGQVRGIPNPSSALVKATLINGAASMAPGQYGEGPAQEVPYLTPNNVAGWGRLDLAAAIAPPAPLRLWAEDRAQALPGQALPGQGLRTGDQVLYHLTTSGGPHPLRVTLAWADYPAALGVARTLVNDLDLEVIAPGGQHYYGNSGPGRDRANNVESVWVAAAPAGTWQVIVRAHNVPQGAQPYAIVASAPDLVVRTEATPTPSATPTGTASAPATATPGELCPDPYEPNDTPEAAIPVENGIEYVSYICHPGDQDYWRLPANAGDPLQVALYDLPQDYDLDLYGPDGSLVGYSQAYGVEPEYIEATAPQSGDYRALVYGFSGAADSAHPYRLRFTAGLLTPTPRPPTPTATPSPTPTPTLLPLHPAGYLPLVSRVWPTLAPQPGYWRSGEGALDFYVAPDRRTVRGFHIRVEVTGCGSYDLWQRQDLSVVEGNFSFAGAFRGGGTFTSPITATAYAELNDYYIVGCGRVWGGPWQTEAAWQDESQPAGAWPEGARAAPARSPWRAEVRPEG